MMPVKMKNDVTIQLQFGFIPTSNQPQIKYFGYRNMCN